MKKKKVISIVIITLLIFGLISWFWYELTWEGERNLGDLSHPCNKEYKINITHYSEFEWAQPLYFNIKKNDTILNDFGGKFEITNNTREKLKSFEIHCYDGILYVTWKDGNVPVIMFGTNKEHLYYLNSNNEDKYKKELFDRLKKGNPHLRWGGELPIDSLVNQCNKDYSVNLSYTSSGEESPVVFNISKSDSIVTGYTLSVIYNEENPVRFEGFCYDNIFYVTQKNQNIPLIMVDSNSELIAFKGQGDQIHPNYLELFDRIKIGNPKLEYD